MKASVFEQAPRRERDGGVSIIRREGGDFAIICEDTGQRQLIVCTPYNAARIFAALAITLGIKLPRVLVKSIQL